MIRPTGDEASGLLVTAQFLTWALARYLAATDWIWGRVSKTWIWIVLPGAVLVGGSCPAVWCR